MSSEVTKWWKDVEDANAEMQWGFRIDNGDYDDVEAMHAAMFDMLDELKEKGAHDLFELGKKIYNKYAKYSKYNEDLKEVKKKMSYEDALAKLNSGDWDNERFNDAIMDGEVEMPKEESLKEAPENPSTHLGYKEDGEEVIKQVGHSYLLKKGKRYIVRYAPGYYVNDIKASSDEEAINKFLGLEEDLQKLGERKSKRRKLNFTFTGDPAKNVAFFNHANGVEDNGAGVAGPATMSLGEDKVCESQDDYYVVSDGINPRHSYVFDETGRDSAISLVKGYKGDTYWEVLHYVNGNPKMIYNTKDGAIEEK